MSEKDRWVGKTGVPGVSFALIMLPLVEGGLPVVLFKHAKKILIFKSVDIAKAACEYAESQTPESVQRELVAMGYYPHSSVMVMGQQKWELFQAEQVGQWVYCETLEEFQAIVDRMPKTLQKPARPVDLN